MKLILICIAALGLSRQAPASNPEPLQLGAPLRTVEVIKTASVTLLWDYSAPMPDSFTIYTTADLSTPASQWGVLTNVNGTNLSVTISIQTGQHFFTATASNYWGESERSNVVLTPPVATNPPIRIAPR